MKANNKSIRLTCAVLSTLPSDHDKVSVLASIVYSSSWRDKKATFEEWMSPLRLSGMPISVTTDKKSLPRQMPPLRKGSLFVCSVEQSLIEYLLECVLSYMVPDAPLVTSDIQPVSEPCVRVPLSVLRELRGQEGTIEATRSAIVSVWNKKSTGETNDK